MLVKAGPELVISWLWAGLNRSCAGPKQQAPDSEPAHNQLITSSGPTKDQLKPAKHTGIYCMFFYNFLFKKIYNRVIQHPTFFKITFVCVCVFSGRKKLLQIWNRFREWVNYDRMFFFWGGWAIPFQPFVKSCSEVIFDTFCLHSSIT